MRKQWAKLSSTHVSKKKEMRLIKTSDSKDVSPIVDAWIKGHKVSKVYVDGGAQMCVMIKRKMDQLGLEFDS